MWLTQAGNSPAVFLWRHLLDGLFPVFELTLFEDMCTMSPYQNFHFYRDGTMPEKQSYEDVEKFVWMLIHRNAKKFNYREPEDLLTPAYEAYLAARRSYDPNRGIKFTTYLGTCINNKLSNVIRGHNKLVEGVLTNISIEMLSCLKRQEFNFDEFCDGFTEDSKTVIRLLLNPPVALTVSASDKGGRPYNWRSSLREYLHESGWSVARVTKAFRATKSAIFG